jgi:dTDP-4-dehydrorhamnose reductase
MDKGKILILGAKGMLGGQLLKVFAGDAVGWDREDLDVTDFKKLESKLLEVMPGAVINCVAYNDVDGAETKKELALKLNAEVPGELARICNNQNIPIVHFSTNYVFNGEKGEYKEDDQPNPLSVYAESKYQGEMAVQNNTVKFYLVRTAVIFGPKGESELSKKSFVDLMLSLVNNSPVVKAVADEINSITYVVDLAGQIKLLLSRKLPFGIYHVTNYGQASWYDFSKEIFRDSNKVVEVLPVSSAEFRRPAVRPKKAVLVNTKLPQLRSWQEALAEFLKAHQ